MFRILVMNGLLISLIIIWTSAAMETSSRTLIKTTADFQAEPLNSSESKPMVSLYETLMNIKGRKTSCSSELGGVCVNEKKSCPSHLPSQKPGGKPYCSRKHRCCYKGISCNLEWKYEGHRPLIMIRETKSIIPPVKDTDISEDPNRIPAGKKLIFACPGENNQFENAPETHTKFHGECTTDEKFKVCVNNYPVFLDLSQLACSRQMFPSIIKQQGDTKYKKSCDDIGGELYKLGYIYGDNKEIKDLDTQICFREKDQKTLWTSTNLNNNERTPGERYMDTPTIMTAKGFDMKTFHSQKSQNYVFGELSENQLSVWNDTTCLDHGGQCVRGGIPCRDDLPYQTSQGEPFCTSFYRCCYSESCNPVTCTYKGQAGNCSLESLPGTTAVGNQECKKGCQCYIKNKRPQEKNTQVMSRMLQPCITEPDSDCIWEWTNEEEKTIFLPLIYDKSIKDVILPIMEVIPQKIETRVTRIGNTVAVIFACSGTKFVGGSDSPSIIHAKCLNKRLLNEDNADAEIKWENLRCKGMITPSTATFLEKTEENKRTKKLCDSNNGKMWRFGFDIGKVEDPLFYSMIDVCFYKDNKKAIFTFNKIHGKSYSARYLRGKDKEPEWQIPPAIDFFSDITRLEMDTIYKYDTQIPYFNKILEVKDVVSVGKYFNQGHLAPRSDFMTRAMQEATYNFLIVIPQWNKFNSQNWAFIEEDIQKNAGNEGRTLSIITYGLDNPMKIGEKFIYIGNEKDGKESNKKLPVPRMFQKIVIEKEIMFLSYNNPNEKNILKTCPNGAESNCKDSVFGLTERTLKFLPDPNRGPILCCRV